MTPRDVVEKWVTHFNAGDADALAALYHEDAVNHQITQAPVVGKAAFTTCSSGNSLPPR